MHKGVLGWDIGGAHVKASLINQQGVAERVLQVACPLWRGTSHLVEAMKAITQHMNMDDAQSVITMTGELVDLFQNRHDGVVRIAQVVEEVLGANVKFYAGPLGFVSSAQLLNCTAYIASMNWHASASFIAQHISGGLFVDVGSTTTDIVPFDGFTLRTTAYSDAERMSHDGLVYTGVVRTPLMALGQKMKFRDSVYHLAAEHFATTADVYRLLGELPERDDLAETADGQDKTMLASARRLARMVGHDVEDATQDEWIQLALNFKSAQIAQLKVVFSQYALALSSVIVGAGAGVFLIKQIAEEMNVKFIAVSDYVKAVNEDVHQQAMTCFPSYALARLWLNGAY